MKTQSKQSQTRKGRRPSSQTYSRVAGLIGLIAVVLLLSQSLPAQTPDTATIRGQVTDQNGAAVTDAEITLVNQLTGLKREARTDANGYYNIAGLPLTGRYTLRVARSGFATSEQKKRLSCAQRKRRPSMSR